MEKRNKIVKAYTLPFAEEIEAVTGVHISNTFKRHIHKVYIVGKVSDGKRIITHPKGSSEIPAGELFIINPGQVHSCASAQGTRYHSYQILSITSDKIQSVAKEVSEQPENKPYFPKVHYQDTKISRKIGNLFTLLATYQSQVEIEAELISLLSNLIQKYSEPPPQKPLIDAQAVLIKRVCTYIAKHYSENLSLDHLSKIAGLSPFHFQRVFTKSMGISAHDYLRYYRIGESREMLLKSQKIADIAYKTGFADQSHFSKIFQMTVGIPPGKYLEINTKR